MSDNTTKAVLQAQNSDILRNNSGENRLLHLEIWLLREKVPVQWEINNP